MANFLGKSGLNYLWGKIKALVATKQDTLVSGENIKTINGETLLGAGDVKIDLSLYKVVTELPTSGIDENKIYLVANNQTSGTNIYTEYIHVNSKWEVVGEYKAEVDLTPYAKSADVTTQLATKADKSDTYTKDEVDKKVAASGTFDSTQYYTKKEVDAKETALKAVATTSADGMMSSTDKAKLDAVESGAQANVIEAVKVDGTALSVSGKAVNIDLSGKVDKETGKGLSTNDYTTAEKTKLAGIAEGATKVTVDSALSGTSTNPVQNKVINTALAGKQATLTAGENITISGSTISAKDTTYGNASANAAGLMSAADYSKLAAIDANATADGELTDEEIDEACA